MDSAKMLSEGKLIAVRTHTRFIHFPAHRHNFIEVLYVCQGFRSTADTESSGKYDFHDHTGLHRTAVPHSNPYRTLCQTESAYACP